MGQQSGIFLINKPKGLSTNQLIQQVKRRLKIEKVGHAGTLDPLAEGLVIVLVNQATKLAPILINEEKGYIATVKLFTSTTTADLEGEVLKKEKPVLITDSQLKDLAFKFNSYHYEQETPFFSAVKVKGQKLYEYARKNEFIPAPKRQVIIKKFDIKNYDSDHHTLEFQTIVSKGTYIRALAEDIAKHLNTVGHLQQLTRIQSGNFKIDRAKN